MRITVTDPSLTPTRAHDQDAGLDLYAAEPALIQPRGIARIRTGVAVELPTGTYGKLEDRSSMASRGLTGLGGVIDQPYRGEIIAVIANVGGTAQHICRGDKITQLVVKPIVFPSVEVVESLTTTERGAAGFGSTGR